MTMPVVAPVAPDTTARTRVAYFVGVDLGQAADYTAIAVLERRDYIRPIPWHRDELVLQRRAERRRPDPEPVVPPAFDVVHLDRLPLNTAYPAVARYVADLMRRPELVVRAPESRKPTPPDLVVDATGVGRPVVDLLKQAGLAPVPITITGGDAVQYERGGWRVPKRELVSGLQVLLQAHRLRISNHLPHAQTLIDELMRFKVKIDVLTGHDSYGAWRTGEHDDVVLATAVAAWWGQRWKPPINAQEWGVIGY